MKRNIFTAFPLFAILVLPLPAKGAYTFEDGNYWSPAIETISNLRDPQECASRCDQNPNCLVASYHSPFAPDGWAYKCVLRNGVGERHLEQKGIMSWVKPPDHQQYSYLFDYANYWGTTLETISDMRDPRECASRCDRDQKCKVASFHGPRAPEGWAYKCVLRGAVGERHTDQVDIWSWVKP